MINTRKWKPETNLLECGHLSSPEHFFYVRKLFLPSKIHECSLLKSQQSIKEIEPSKPKHQYWGSPRQGPRLTWKQVGWGTWLGSPDICSIRLQQLSPTGEVAEAQNSSWLQQTHHMRPERSNMCDFLEIFKNLMKSRWWVCHSPSVRG